MPRPLTTRATTSVRRLPVVLVAAAILAAIVAGCAGTGQPNEAGFTLVPASPATGFPGWPTGPDPDAAMVPIIVSSERVVGANRFLYALTDTANQPIAAPDLTTTVRFFDLAADPAKPVSEQTGTFMWTLPDEIGLYRVNVDFPRAGQWGVEIEASGGGQPDRTSRAMFDVREAPSTPIVGARAPASETPTATDPAGIAAISTDQDPEPAFYRTSVRDALAAGRPFLLIFSTPQFCASRTCGPTLDTVKTAVAPFGDALDVIHVEPYKLMSVDGQLQPELDAKGGFQVVPSVTEWGIPTEPYAFLVGADGKVAAKFEGALGADELQAAIEAIVGPGS